MFVYKQNKLKEIIIYAPSVSRCGQKNMKAHQIDNTMAYGSTHLRRHFQKMSGRGLKGMMSQLHSVQHSVEKKTNQTATMPSRVWMPSST